MTKQLVRSQYDVVVVGAGPAGLNACLHVLEGNPALTVLLVDKHIPWEKPIACAEGAGRRGLSSVMTMEPSWVRHNIGHASFHAPDGTVVNYSDPDKGYIIDRTQMQRDLAARCSEKGAHVVLGTKVINVSAPALNGCRTLSLENDCCIKSKVVIDASGPSSPLGKKESPDWKAEDSEPSYFAVVEGVEHDCDTIHLWIGKEIAPGGYCWMFPSKDKLVNIGIVVGKRSRGNLNIRDLLNDFIALRFPDARIIRTHAGIIPCATRPRRTGFEGMLKCGDAACTVNPVSRAGICEALNSGAMAGDFAVKIVAARNRRESLSICRKYEKAWHKRLGARHIKLAKVKGSLSMVPDSDYNAAAKSLSSLPAAKRTMGTIFRVSLRRFPRLAWALRHMM